MTIFILVIILSVTNILDPTLLVVLAGVTGVIIKNFVRKTGKEHKLGSGGTK